MMRSRSHRSDAPLHAARSSRPIALPRRKGKTSRAAFTLTELLVAIVVLLVVIAATAKIFGTVSRITAVGQATQDVLTESAAIQRLMQEDISRINPQGILAIRNVEVRNGVNSGALLNPILDPQAKLRCDQVLFFRHGLSAMQTSRLANDDAHKGQATVALVLWTHGWQFPGGEAFDSAGTSQGRAHDPIRPSNISTNDDINVQAITPANMFSPWFQGDAITGRTLFETIGGNNTATGIFGTTTSGTFDCRQPESRKWLLCRQQIALGDDDSQNANTDAKTVYMIQNQMARSVFYNHPAYGGVPGFASRQIRDGRIDGAGTRLNDIREAIVRWSGLPTARERWIEQREFIVANMMRYPRAERQAPSMHRVDQALTNHVLGVACSSFRVDWTWAPGKGAASSAAGTDVGFQFGPGWNPNTNVNPEEQTSEQPWFGWQNPEAGVYPLNFANLSNSPAWWRLPDTIFPPGNPNNGWTTPSAIERYRQVGANIGEYWAIFGFNATESLIEDPTDPNYGLPDANLNYTPWPSAIRVTMTLHDIDTNLEHGRVVQFIVPLPERFEQ